MDRSARQSLAQALDFIREEDTLVVTKLDRLARSVRHLHGLLDAIEKKGAFLRILSMSIDTATSTGKLMLTIMGGVAEFERQIMLERQREGIAKAKAEGRYKGRRPTARAKAQEVQKLLSEGATVAQVVKALEISRESVYRLV